MAKNYKSITVIILLLVIAVTVFVKFFLVNAYKTKYSLNYETALLSMHVSFLERNGKALKRLYKDLPKPLQNNNTIAEKYLFFLVNLAEFQEAQKVSLNITQKTDTVELANNIVFLQKAKELSPKGLAELLTSYENKGQFITIFSSLFNIWYLVQEGKEEDALDILNSSLSSSLFYRHIARAFYAKGNVEKSLEMFEKADLEGSVVNYSLIFEYINLLIENNKQEKALELYSKYFNNKVTIEFLTAKAKDFKITSVNNSISDVLLQISYVVSGFDYNIGLQFAYYSLLINENNAAARTHLASLFLNKFNDKLLAYNLVKGKDLSNIIYYDFFTRNYSAFKDINEISYENVLLKLYKSLPENYSVLVDLSYLYIANNNYRKAVNVLSYIENNANLKEDLQLSWYIYFYKGIINAKLKDVNGAKEYFEKAKAIDGKNPVMLNYYAYTLIANDSDIDYAIKMLKQALEIQKLPEFLDSYAWALFKKGNYQEAKSLLEEALEGMPYSVEVNDHIGDVYWQLGRKQIAKFHWQEALRIAKQEKPKSKALAYSSHKEAKAITNKLNGILPNYLSKNVTDSNKQEYKNFIKYYKAQ